ncbi:MAG: efflux RND transporter periplasmic adaptor subunit [Syntrophaceae bacterium]|nr:efflux RND transporter periplasmic adaptor subunit [Syntrophaceae bacterium]
MKRRKTIFLVVTTLVGIFLVAIVTGNLVKKTIDEPKAEHLQDSDGQNHGPDKHAEKDDVNANFVKISELAIKEEGITVSVAAPGKLRVTATFPGEIVINPDHMAHIVPRMGGIVIEVRKKVGDQVSAGEVMAIMASKELAVTKANYLATIKRLELATSNFVRFESLWQKSAVPEKQYLEIKTAREEAEIEKNSAEQKLRALGFNEKLLQRLPEAPADSLSRYEIAAPFQGTVIQKHITLGEMLKDDTTAFVIADLSSVWVYVYIYPKDLPNIRSGQNVIISVGNGVLNVQGRVENVDPIVGDNTRSAIARVVLNNPDGKLRPGLFVTAKISVENIDVPVVVPKTALKNIENKTVTFIRKEGGFEPKIVKRGRVDNSHVEILSGLQAGERFASDGSFILRAEMGKSNVTDDH